MQEDKDSLLEHARFLELQSVAAREHIRTRTVSLDLGLHPRVFRVFLPIAAFINNLATISKVADPKTPGNENVKMPGQSVVER